MCRLLAMKSNTAADPIPYLEYFAEMCRTSKEYQGHGWGCAFMIKNEWHIYKSINPIWKSNFEHIPKSNILLVHARSAFRDEGIVIENNMPFSDNNYQFIFNGELHGVKIKENGRIGAEKIFNFIKRFERGSIIEAIQKGVSIIERKAKYIRAMNFIISDGKDLYVNSFYNEDPNYFQLYVHSGTEKIVCSQPFNLINDWEKIDNKEIKVY